MHTFSAFHINMALGSSRKGSSMMHHKFCVGLRDNHAKLVLSWKVCLYRNQHLNGAITIREETDTMIVSSRQIPLKSLPASIFGEPPLSPKIHFQAAHSPYLVSGV